MRARQRAYKKNLRRIGRRPQLILRQIVKPRECFSGHLVPLFRRPAHGHEEARQPLH